MGGRKKEVNLLGVGMYTCTSTKEEKLRKVNHKDNESPC